MTKHYFTDLNYTLGNEDLTVEYKILQNEFPQKNINICAIAGSGNRSVILLTQHTKEIVYCDTSAQQLALTELRTQSLKYLTHAEFLDFFGYTSTTPVKRKALFAKIKTTKKTGSTMAIILKEHQWKELIYIGKWERTFYKISRMIRVIAGNKIRTLINIDNSNDYFSFLNTTFPVLRWNLAIFIIGNATMFNKLLYKGAFPENNVSKSIYTFYKNSFNKVFNQGVAKTNFFLNILINGTIEHADAFPIECNEKLFEQARNNIKTTRFTYNVGNLLDVAQNYKNHFHYIVLSDIPSYFQGPQEQIFLQLLHPSLHTGGIVVMRFYLHIPQNVDCTGFLEITTRYKEVIEKEKVGMYAIKVFQKI